MVKSSKTDAIELPPLKLELMDVTLVGDTPLIVHAWSAKAKGEMLAKQMKKAQPKKGAKNPVKDFEESLYRLHDGGYGFPSIAFKSAAVTAVTSVSGMTKVAARQAFQVLGEDIDVQGAFDGTKMRLNLARIKGCEPTMREDMVRIGMGTADLRYRGEFFPWFSQVKVRFNANVLSAEQILSILNTAGFAVGIGEWRTEKDGMNGAFHVATDADLQRMSVLEMPRAA